MECANHISSQRLWSRLVHGQNYHSSSWDNQCQRCSHSKPCSHGLIATEQSSIQRSHGCYWDSDSNTYRYIQVNSWGLEHSICYIWQTNTGAKKYGGFCEERLFHETEHGERWRFWWRKDQDRGRHSEFGSNLRRCREWSEVQVFVDVIVVIGINSAAVEKFTQCLGIRFSLKDLGSLSYFLRIEAHRTAEGILLTQQKNTSQTC